MAAFLSLHCRRSFGRLHESVEVNLLGLELGSGEATSKHPNILRITQLRSKDDLRGWEDTYCMLEEIAIQGRFASSLHIFVLRNEGLNVR